MKTRLLLFQLFLAQCVFAQWNIVNLNTSSTIYGISFYGNNEVWLSSDTGLIKSTNGGSNFNFYPLYFPSGIPYPSSRLYDVSIINSNVAVGAVLAFLGNDEMILRTINGGLNWDTTHVQLGTFLAALRCVDFPTLNTGFIAGWDGRIYRSVNGGLFWLLVNSNPGYTWYDMAMTSNTEGVVVGDQGISYTPTGAIWNSVVYTAGTGQVNVVSFKNAIGYAGGYTFATGAGTLYKSTNNGTSWTTLNFPFDEIRAIATLSEDTIIVGTRNELYRTSDGGQYWEKFLIPQGTAAHPLFKCVRFMNSNEGYAVGENGYCIQSTNGGGTVAPVSLFSFTTGVHCTGVPDSVINKSNPACSSQWILNGSVVSTQYSPYIIFTIPGNNDLSLVSFNGTNYDTLTQTINILPTVDVLPFSSVDDSICKNTTATFVVPASQNGIIYKLRNGFTTVGTQQTGNGNDLSFTTSNLSATTNFNIIGSYSNACATDSFIVNITALVVEPSLSTIFSLSRDTVCGKDTSHVIILNTEIGFSYKWKCTPGILGAYYAAGTGGTIELDLGAIVQTVVVTVETKHDLGCVSTLAGSKTLVLHGTTLEFSAPVSGVLIGDSISFINYSSNFTSYNWNFGAYATPQTYTGFTPPDVSYSISGFDTVTLYGVYNSTCNVMLKKAIGVYDHAPVISMPDCAVDTPLYFSGVVDMALNNHNSTLIATYDPQPSSGVNFCFVASSCDSASRKKWWVRPDSYFVGQTSFTHAITYDNLDNAYIAVRFVGNPYLKVFGKCIYDNNFIMKVSPEGKFLWLITSKTAQFIDLTTTDDNNIYVIGNNVWSGTNIIFPDGDVYDFIPSQDTSGEAFIMGFTPEGKLLEFTPFGREYVAGNPSVKSSISFLTNYIVDPVFYPSDALLHNLSIKAGSNGDLYIGGFMEPARTNDIYEFGNKTLNLHAVSDTIVNHGQLFGAKYIRNSGFANAFSIIAGDPYYFSDFDFDASDNMYFTGSAKKFFISDSLFVNLQFQQSVGASTFDKYYYLIKTDSTGNIIWYNYNKDVSYADITVVPGGDVFLSAGYGAFGAFLDGYFHPYGINSLGLQNTAILRLDQNGYMQSLEHKGAGAYSTPLAMERDACNNLHVLKNNGYSHIFASSVCSQNCYAAYDTSALDLSLQKLFLSDTSSFGPSARDLRFNIRNRALSVATSFVVKYRINNDTIQTFSWNGSFVYGQNLDSVFVTNYNFTGSSYFRIKMWIDKVNGISDNVQENDTLYITQLVCNGTFAGTYSLGSDTSYFDTFSASVRALETCGVSGNTVIEAAPGVYHDEMYINGIPGSSDTAEVTWTSLNHDSSSVVFQLKPSHRVTGDQNIVIDDAGNITVSEITIINKIPRDNSQLIILTYKFHDINILNCKIEGLKGPDNELIRVYVMDTIIKLGINNNRMIYGSNAVRLSSSNLYPSEESGIEIKGNEFEWQVDGPIRTTNISNLLVEGNAIRGDDSVLTGPSYAIYAYHGSHLKFLKNSIHLKNLISTVIYIVDFDATDSTRSLIANNMICVGPGLNNSNGLYVDGSRYLDIINNTFGSPISFDNVDYINVKNNIISNNSGYSINWTNSSPNDVFFDHNVYSLDTSAGTMLFVTNGNYYDFAGWQNVPLLLPDQNSYLKNPVFVSPYDLHLAVNDSLFGIPWPAIIEDIDNEIRSVSSPNIGADEFGTAQQIYNVWPGDADANGHVDNYDILPIGFHFNQAGFARSTVTNAWAPQYCDDWVLPLQLVNSKNRKHADCNGDSIINYGDTIAIRQNYGSVRGNPYPLWYSSTGPDLYFVTNDSVFVPNDTVNIDIWTGTVTQPIDSLFGIGFQMTIDPNVYLNGSLSCDVSDNWMCGLSNCVTFSNANQGTGQCDGTIVKTDSAVSGYGKIADISFIVNPNLSAGTTLNLNLNNYNAYNQSGDSILFNIINDSLIVITSTGIDQHNLLSSVTVFPNPVGDEVFVSFSMERKADVSISLLDMTGRRLKHKEYTNYASGVYIMNLNLQSFASGMYVVELKSGEHAYRKRIVKN